MLEIRKDLKDFVDNDITEQGFLDKTTDQLKNISAELTLDCRSKYAELDRLKERLESFDGSELFNPEEGRSQIVNDIEIVEELLTCNLYLLSRLKQELESRQQLN